MSRAYVVPADVREKEKIIGGILTIGQFGWCIGGFLIGLASFAGTFLLVRNLTISAMVGLPLVFSGLPFAFYKKRNVPLPIYIMRKFQFKSKNHKLPNQRTPQ